MNEQFFATGDRLVEGPPRDFVGYGEHPPRIRWPGGRKVAVQIVVNDARFVLAQGYGSPEHFFAYAKASLDRLRADGDDVARMMSIGLHPRFSGQPPRADALARFIEYGQRFDDVWFARRIDVAQSFREQMPAPRCL